MRNKNIQFFFLGILFLLLIPAGVTASSVSLSPNQINNGGLVTIHLSDIPNGSYFSILLQSRFDVTPGAKFSFETNNFYLPITLTSGEISAYTKNTKSTGFTVVKGDSSIGVANSSDANGEFRLSKSQDVGSGTYETLTVSGRALPDISSIVAQFQLSGTKQGPDNSDISFNLGGIDNGLVFVTVYVGSSPALDNEKITIGSPTYTSVVVSATQATAEPTIVATSVLNATKTATAAATPTATKNSWVSFTSADGVVKIIATGVDNIGFIQTQNQDLPDGWVRITSDYTLSPASITFTEPATIRFTIPSDKYSDEYGYFIARYDGTSWTPVASESVSEGIAASITKPGTYALLAIKSEGSSQQAGASATKVTNSGTPKIASIAAKATTANAPVSWVIPLAALLGVVLLYKRSRI